MLALLKRDFYSTLKVIVFLIKRMKYFWMNLKTKIWWLVGLWLAISLWSKLLFFVETFTWIKQDNTLKYKVSINDVSMNLNKLLWWIKVI